LGSETAMMMSFSEMKKRPRALIDLCEASLAAGDWQPAWQGYL